MIIYENKLMEEIFIKIKERFKTSKNELSDADEVLSLACKENNISAAYFNAHGSMKYSLIKKGSYTSTGFNYTKF